MISNFLFNFNNFCVIVSFLPKLVTLAISFSTALRAVLVDKLVISDILSSTLFILTLYAYFYIHLYIIHLYIYTFIHTLYIFFTTSLSLLESRGRGTNL